MVYSPTYSACERVDVSASLSIALPGSMFLASQFQIVGRRKLQHKISALHMSCCRYRWCGIVCKDAFLNRVFLHESGCITHISQSISESHCGSRRERKCGTVLMSGYKGGRVVLEVLNFWNHEPAFLFNTCYVCSDARFFSDLKAECYQHACRRNSPEQPYRSCL